MVERSIQLQTLHCMMSSIAVLLQEIPQYKSRSICQCITNAHWMCFYSASRNVNL